MTYTSRPARQPLDGNSHIHPPAHLPAACMLSPRAMLPAVGRTLLLTLGASGPGPSALSSSRASSSHPAVAPCVVWVLQWQDSGGR